MAALVLVPAAGVLALLGYGFGREAKYIPTPFIAEPAAFLEEFGKHVGALGWPTVSAKIEEALRGVVSATEGRGDYRQAVQ